MDGAFPQVLYPTAPSEASPPAIDDTAAVARSYAARLTVLHVVPTLEPSRVPSERPRSNHARPSPTRDAAEADVTRALPSRASSRIAVHGQSKGLPGVAPVLASSAAIPSLNRPRAAARANM